jgi:hypothetical protein
MKKSDFNLSDFSAAIKSGGVSRPTRFEVVLRPPTSLAVKMNSKEISIRCNTGALPPMNIKTRDYMIGQGQIRKTPWGYDQGHELPFTFYNDARSKVYDGLLMWTKSILFTNVDNDYRLNYYNEYVGTIEVRQLDEQDNVRYSYTLFEAYPIKVEHVQLDSSHVNEAQLITATFAYRYARNAWDIIKNTQIDYKVKTGASAATYNPTTHSANRRRSIDDKLPSGDDDPSMTTTVKIAKGVGLTPTQLYNMCTGNISRAHEKGTGLITAQNQWVATTTTMNNALASGDVPAINSAFNATKTLNSTMNAGATDFYSNTRDAVSSYNTINTSVSSDDPVHGDMGNLKSLYNQVSLNQTNNSLDFNLIEKSVNNITSQTTITLG